MASSTTDFVLQFRVTGHEDMQRVLRMLNAGLQGVHGSAGMAGTGMAGLGQAGAAAGKGAQAGASGLRDFIRQAGAVAAGVSAANTAVSLFSTTLLAVRDSTLQFQHAMTESLAIAGDVSASLRREMEQAAVDVAVRWGIASDQVAASYYDLISAGLSAEEALHAVDRAAAFARAGAVSMTEATDLAATSLGALGLRGESTAETIHNLTRLTDYLVGANNIAAGSTIDFATALTHGAGQAFKMYGASLEEAIGLLVVLANQGTLGANAGERVNILLREMQQRARENADAWARWGVAVFDAEGNTREIADVIADLEVALGGLSARQRDAALAELGFTRQGLRSINMLMGQSDALRQATDRMARFSGAVDEVANRQMRSWLNRLAQAREWLLRLAAEGVGKLVEGVRFLIDEFKDSGENIAVIAQIMWEAVDRTAEAFAVLVTGATVLGIKALAEVLGELTGYLADNEWLVRLLAAALMTKLVVALATTAGAMAAVGWSSMVAGIRNVLSWIPYLIAQLQIAQARMGTLGAMKWVWTSIAPTAGATAALALFTYGIFDLNRAMDKARDKGREMARGLTEDLDPTSVISYRENIEEMRASYEEARARFEDEGGGGSFWDRARFTLDGLTEMLPFVESSAVDAYGAMAALGEELARLEAESARVYEGLSEVWAQTIGADLDATPVQEVFEEQLQMLSDLAAAADIDLSGPVTEWAGALIEAYRNHRTLNTAAESLVGTLDDTAGGFEDVGEAVDDARDKIDAFKDLIEGLMGVEQDFADAQVEWAATFEELTRTVTGFMDGDEWVDGTGYLTLQEMFGPGGQLVPGAEEFNRKLSEGKDAIVDLMHAAVDRFGGEGALYVFQSAAQQVEEFGAQAGLAREQIDDMLVRLGLTEGVWEILLEAEDLENVEEFAAYVYSRLEEIDGIEAEPYVRIRGAAEARSQLSEILTLARNVSSFEFAGPARPGSTSGPARGTLAEGGVVRFYASGGQEDHVAQIAPAGAWRIWAEPETGGEAYIPLAPSKRARSMAVLADVAHRFGAKLLPYQAGGWYGIPDPAPVGDAIAAAVFKEQARGVFAQTVRGTNVGQIARYLTAMAGGTPEDIARRYEDAVARIADAYHDVAFTIGEDAARFLAAQDLTPEEFEAAARAMTDAYQEELRKQEEARKEAERQAAESAKKAREIQDAMFETGAIDNATYKAILRERMAATEQYSAEWMDAWRELRRIEEEEAAAAERAAEEAAANARKAAEEARRAAEAARKEYDHFVASIRDPFAGPGIVGTFGSRQDVTGGEIMAFLRHTTEAQQMFAATLDQLAGLGLSGDMLTQLAQQGPQALQLARTLASLGASGIAQVNAQVNAQQSAAQVFAERFAAGAGYTPTGGAPAQQVVNISFGDVQVSGGMTKDEVKRTLTDAVNEQFRELSARLGVA